MKKAIIIILANALTLSAFAQTGQPQLKWYGFVRNYYAFDTRESTAGTDDLFYYMPKDNKFEGNVDLNAVPSFRTAALTSRLGLDIINYEAEGYKIGGKIEADFYSGLTGNTGTAQFRLRQAYVTVAKNSRNWKMGQAWHPMAADMPDIFSLETGAPFGAFSRTPQVALTLAVDNNIDFSLAGIWQMQYTSPGPEGNSANYIKYGCVPELYAGISFKGEKSDVLRIGADITFLKPYRYKLDKKSLSNSYLVEPSLFLYAQKTSGFVTLKTKLIYASDGSHYNLVGGYGVNTADGDYKYVPTHNLSWWATASYKKSKKWVPSLFVGYVQNFGTSEDVTASYYKLSANTVSHLWRIQPEIVYNLGKLQFGLEYMCTGVEYGDAGTRIVAASNIHTVVNHRIQSLVKFTF